LGSGKRRISMRRWGDFANQAPEIAEAGRALLYQFGPGLAYLATVRADGGPRLHPVCVNLVDGGLYTLVVPSPKRQDLLRDGRFALHSFASATVDDEFFLAGRAIHQESPSLIARVRAAQQATGATTSDTEELFEYYLERALYSRYKPRGEPNNWPPAYLKWAAA
jgi:hypothetical protein